MRNRSWDRNRLDPTRRHSLLRIWVNPSPVLSLPELNFLLVQISTILLLAFVNNKFLLKERLSWSIPEGTENQKAPWTVKPSTQFETEPAWQNSEWD